VPFTLDILENKGKYTN